jgi:hypothetical protein
MQGYIAESTQGGAAGVQATPPPNEISKHRFFLDMLILNILLDLPFSRNQPLKSADISFIGTLKKEENIKYRG